MARRHNWQMTLRVAGLVAIALFTFHALSSLLFGVLGLAPSSPQWSLALILGSFLAIAGATVGMQSLKFIPQRLTGLVSGASSIAILAAFSLGALSGHQAEGVLIGAIAGLIIGGWGGFCTGHRQGFWQVAIALISSLCAYGTAFGLSSWAWAAATTQRWPIAIGLGVCTALYLWFTQQGLTWVYHQWQHDIKREPQK
ncbi:hypothetical protein Lepto7375DRAFT_2241 [Leptolyngbya sp. PCC 7375]|nr:hypothetical protein Lepto7375DRAFT_2241 [Leptolyngbya sp. PCC 7375]